MKFLFASILLIASSVAYTINLGPESKRLPSWRQVMYEQDDAVDPDKFVLKLNLNVKAELFFHDEIEWTSYATLKENKNNVFTLDSGSYYLKIEAPGKETVSRTVYGEGGHFMEVNVVMQAPRPTSVRKPVVYINTPKTINISLKINPVGEFTFTYPEHSENGWSFTAQTDGTLDMDGKKYDYLFWESIQENLTVDTDYGYCIAGTGVVEFLENKLTQLGFNDREMQDFITFWAPIMQENPYNFVNFVIGEEYDSRIAEYESSVDFDSELRVFMAFEPLDAPIKVKEQTLPVFDRTGLSLIEWGGGEIDQINESIQSL